MAWHIPRLKEPWKEQAKVNESLGGDFSVTTGSRSVSLTPVGGGEEQKICRPSIGR